MLIARLLPRVAEDEDIVTADANDDEHTDEHDRGHALNP